MYLCLRVKDIYRNNIKAGNCAKKCHLNQENPQELKGKSYKLPKKTIVKKMKHMFLLSH